MKPTCLWLLLLAAHSLSAQKSDTTWWEKDQIIQSITNKTGNTWNIVCWHRNGRQMTSGQFLLRSGLVPLSNVIIIDSNGHKLQEYKVSSGTLINYLPGGKIKDVLISPLQDTTDRYAEYYTSGKLKQSRYAQKDTGRNGIYFFYPDHTRKVSFIYQQEMSAAYHYQQFYPNGRLYFQQIFYRTANNNIFTAWYKENGEIDTTAYIDRGKSGYSFDKMGRRLEWWNNGHLKSEEYFIANYNDSVARYWHENGRLQLEKFVRNGTQTGITRAWHENGRLKYYADYRNSSSGKPSLTFHENGNVSNMDNDIVSVYDINGNLTYESISLGRYQRSFDFRNGATNHNIYKGKFNKIRKGKWLVSDEWGRKIYAAQYKDGLLEGELLLFDTSGRINTIAHYREGKLDGEFLAMNSNGTDTLNHGYYDMGRRSGTWRNFFDNGKLESVQSIKGNDYLELEKYDIMGNTLSSSKYVAEEGALYQYFFRGGKLVNMNVKHDTGGVDYYSYHENGKIANVSFYEKDGAYLRRTYFDNGQPETEAYLKKGGYAEGRQYRWHSNGQKQLEGEMINGYQEGEWVMYNEDGSIASKHYFVKGIEQVKAPDNTPCFCNKPMEAIPGSSFFNSTGSYVDLKTINMAMQRFQLDTAFEYTFLRCSYCMPIPIIAVRQQKLWIGRDGMYLDLTPCMQGNNRALVKFNHVALQSLEGEYAGYDNEYDKVKPLTLAEVLTRAMAVYDRDEYNDYQFPLASITGDTGFFRKFLRKYYQVDFTPPVESEEEVEEGGTAATTGLKAAAEKYYETQADESVSFEQDFAQKLAKAIIPFFPAEARILAKDSTNRLATSAIFRKLYASNEPHYLEEKLYGSIVAILDSGTVALVLPSNFIATCDTVTGKKIMRDGKPLTAPFTTKFVSAEYRSFPADCFSIKDHEILNTCVAPFAIGNTGAWIANSEFAYALGKPALEDGYNASENYLPYNYPAHYKNLRVRFNDMFRSVDADLDDYIKNFMGVVIRQGSLHLPGMKEVVPVNDVIIDAKEINGCIRIPLADVHFSEMQLRNALQSAGFNVYGRNYELDRTTEPMIILYFNLQNK